MFTDSFQEEDGQQLREELEEVKAKGRRQSLGNIQFMCELYRLKMITKAIMHDTIVKLLKNHDEDSLECLCTLLSTIGKELARVQHCLSLSITPICLFFIFFIQFKSMIAKSMAFN